MSEMKENNSENEQKVDVTASLISAVSQGNLESVKTLVHSHGLSYCACGNGGYVPLFVAIKLGHIEIATFLLEQGAKTNSDTDHIDTPLHLASVKGYIKIVQLLLRKNALVDARNDQNETPLHLAAREGHAKTVDIFLNNSASLASQTNEGFTPLFLAVKGKHEEVVRILLKHIRDKVKNAAFLNCILLCNPSVRDKVNKLVVQIVITDVDRSLIVNKLIDHGLVLSHEYVNEALLVTAVKKNYIKLINSILRSGANPKDAEHNPLLLQTAIRNGRPEILKLLLNSGFSVRAVNETVLFDSLYFCQEDTFVEIIQLLLANGFDIKEAPELLHRTVDKEFIKVCKILIENGADIYAVNTQGVTPLDITVSDFSFTVSRKPIDTTTRNKILQHFLNSINDVIVNKFIYGAFHNAVSSGRTEAVSIFLEFGVDVDVCKCNEDLRCVPLFLASRHGKSEITEVLCKNNAEVNRPSSSRSPLQYAVYTSKKEIVKVLLKFGADIDFEFNDTCDYSSNDSDDTIWSDDSVDDAHTYCFGACDCVIATVKKHIIRMKAAGLNVSEPNSSNFYRLFYSFEEECKEEISRMKTEKISPQFTLYDMLVNGKKPSFAKNKPLMGVLKSFNFDPFPIYKDLIAGNIELSKSELALLHSGQQTLNVLVKISGRLNDNSNRCTVVPLEILEKILSYLSSIDIKNLVNCGKALKRQLSHR